jgi:hypothetical protein
MAQVAWHEMQDEHTQRLKEKRIVVKLTAFITYRSFHIAYRVKKAKALDKLRWHTPGGRTGEPFAINLHCL